MRDWLPGLLWLLGGLLLAVGVGLAFTVAWGIIMLGCWALVLGTLIANGGRLMPGGGGK